MRIVLDTNTVIFALLWGEPPCRIMDIARHGDTLRLYTSTTLLAELADVLSRDKFIPHLAAHNLTPAAIMQRYGAGHDPHATRHRLHRATGCRR